MELREWKYMNPPKATGNSSSYKNRFKKLIDYHTKRAPDLDRVNRKNISDDSFHLSEHYKTSTDEFDRDVLVSWDKNTDTFYVSFFIDGKQVVKNNRTGWENFLKFLDGYMWLPGINSSEWNDLLTESLKEWKAMNPPAQTVQATTSKTNKEKFTELVSYMQKHKDSSVIFASVNGPNDTGFEYEEQRAFADGSDYNISVEVSLSKHDLFTIHIYADGKRKYNITAKGWGELLRYLRIYFHAPNMGSPEYKSLTESFSSELKEWKLMNSPKASQSTSSSTNKDKFIKLMYNMMKDKLPSVTDVKCVRVDDNGFTYKETRNNVTLGEHVLTLLVGYNKDDSWKYELYIDTTLAEARQGNSMKELLRWLSSYFGVPLPGSKEYSKLCESYTIADDFKLYENLWD